MKTKLLVTAATTAIVVATGGCLAVAAAWAAPASSPEEARAVISALSSRTSALDPLPAALDTEVLGKGGLALETVRYLGEDDGATYRVALDNAAQVCVIVTLKDKYFVTASSCAPASVVQTQGLDIGVQGNPADGSVARTTYLVPDGVDEKAAGAPWTVVTPNILVAPTELADKAGSTSLPSEKNGQEPGITIG